MLEVYIGPNGYGKTKRLESIKQNLITSGVNSNEILFLESELLLMDEVKDTKDSTKTMEYILTELLSTQAIETARQCFESSIDSLVKFSMYFLLMFRRFVSIPFVESIYCTVGRFIAKNTYLLK